MFISNDIEIKIEHQDTVIITNDNTTIGYATLDMNVGELTYIFVHPAFRRRGMGTLLMLAAEKAYGQSLMPSGPISPLGRLFFKKQISKCV
jgi:N-acetylglutamate synthase-like GNAT family acetyltransferase